MSAHDGVLECRRRVAAFEAEVVRLRAARANPADIQAALDALDAARRELVQALKRVELALQWGATPGRGMQPGRIVALSDAEVVQSAGRGHYVAWDRSKLSEGDLQVGMLVTIHESGRIDVESQGPSLSR